MYCGPDGKGFCDQYAYPPGYDYGPTSNPPPNVPTWTNFDDFCELVNVFNYSSIVV
jgi:hypothetical protein